MSIKLKTEYHTLLDMADNNHIAAAIMSIADELFLHLGDIPSALNNIAESINTLSETLKENK